MGERGVRTLLHRPAELFIDSENLQVQTEATGPLQELDTLRAEYHRKTLGTVQLTEQLIEDVDCEKLPPRVEHQSKRCSFRSCEHALEKGGQEYPRNIDGTLQKGVVDSDLVPVMTYFGDRKPLEISIGTAYLEEYTSKNFRCETINARSPYSQASGAGDGSGLTESSR